jgi:tetratricopeptide (TPR) repeat protein
MSRATVLRSFAAALCCSLFAAVAADLASAGDDPSEPEAARNDEDAPDEPTPFERAMAYLEGVEPPAPHAVSDYKCGVNWRADAYCMEVWRMNNARSHQQYGWMLKFAARALEHHGNAREPLAGIAHALVSIDGFDSKRAACERALPFIEASMDIEKASISIGHYLYCIDRIDATPEQYDRQLRLAHLSAHHEVDDPWNWYYLAILQRNRGARDAARHSMRHMLEVASNTSYATWLQYKLLRYEFDDLVGAEEALRRVLVMYRESGEEAEPGDLLDTYLDLFGLYFRLFDFDRARTHTEKLVRELRALSDEIEDERARRAFEVRLTELQRLFEVLFSFIEEGRLPEDFDLAETSAQELESFFTEAVFLDAYASRQLAELEPDVVARLVIADRIRRAILLDDLDEAERLIARRVRESGSSGTLQKWLLEIDFRRKRCGRTGRLSSYYVESSAHGGDAWIDTLFKASWTRLCRGKWPSGEINLSRYARATKSYTSMLHMAATQFARSEYDDAFETLELDEDAPPEAHRFALWVAASVGDRDAHARHFAAARRGGALHWIDLLAEVMLALRSKRPESAAAIFEELPALARVQPALRTYRLVLVAQLVRAALDVEQLELAERIVDHWMRADGPLERRIRESLERTEESFLVDGRPDAASDTPPTTMAAHHAAPSTPSP